LVKRIAQHVAVLERRGLVELWSDTRIQIGEDWESEIEVALSAAKVAVLLISPAFLASKFIWKREMPRIMAHAEQGMEVLPLIVRPCAWQLEEVLAKLQVLPVNARPLSLGSGSQVDLDLAEFTNALAEKLGRFARAITPTVDVSDLASPTPLQTDLTGDWAGFYNRTRAIRLSVRESKPDSFSEFVEYPSDRTVTIVKGSIHETWPRNDDLWARIGSRHLRRLSVRSEFQGNRIPRHRTQFDQL
jgi:hypothetical protein